MDINRFFDKNEKPLDNLISDGGFCGIFRTIGVVGDSLSSGEFEALSEDGVVAYHDFYEYSWGQYMARTIGCKVYNFSRGGMTCKEFCESFGEKCGAWDYDKICQAYIIALGCNDKNSTPEVGSVDNMTASGYNSGDTFAGYYTQIIQRLRAKAPDAKFFLVTQPKKVIDDDFTVNWRIETAQLLRDIADKIPNTYVIDLHRYAPVYDEQFKKSFYLRGHLNPAGYLLTSKMMISYIDYIIRHNIEDFHQTGFINTPYKSVE